MTKVRSARNKTNQNRLWGKAMVPPRAFVVLSGGPGLYEARELPEPHDKLWSNFVDPVIQPLKEGRSLSRNDEVLHWFVYRPAYEARWADDIKNGHKDHRHTQTQRVLDAGFTSYIDNIEKRAEMVGPTTMRLHWISSAFEFWQKLTVAGAIGKISRVWYIGHAAPSGLWLYITHYDPSDPSTPAACDEDYQACSPSPDAIVSVSDVQSRGPKYKYLFQAYKGRPSRFYGCYTKEFAHAWRVMLGVESEGADGTTQFKGASQLDIPVGTKWVKFPFGGGAIETVLVSGKGVVRYDK